jgi:hypothetical protein
LICSQRYPQGGGSNAHTSTTRMMTGLPSIYRWVRSDPTHPQTDVSSTSLNNERH